MSPRIHLVYIAFLCTCLFGCTTLNKPNVGDQSGKQDNVEHEAPLSNRLPSVSETQQSEKTQRISRLLTEAERALIQNRLTTPVEDNAYLRYLQVLASEPNHPSAIDGLNRIVETYVAWSIKALEQGRSKQARDMLHKAKSVDEAHPSIQALERRINTSNEQQTQLHYLSLQDLRNRSPRIIDQLHTLAKDNENAGGKIIITARNDADGRWIYQQMNSATELRIRATIEHGPDPTVQLIYP